MEATDLTVAAGQAEDLKTQHLLLAAAAVANDDRHESLLDKAAEFGESFDKIDQKLAAVDEKIQTLDRHNELAHRVLGARCVPVNLSDGSVTNVHACLTKLVTEIAGIKQRQTAFANKVDTYLGFLNATTVTNEKILEELSLLRRDVAMLKFERGLCDHRRPGR